MPANDNAEQIADLARKWMEGTITEAEMAAFERWYASFEDDAPEVLSDESRGALRERLYHSILRRELSGTHELSGSYKLADPHELSGTHELAGTQELAGTYELAGPHELAETPELGGTHKFPEGKTKSAKVYGYFAAAACVAILSFFTFWWTQNRFSRSPFVQLVAVHAGEQINKTILPDGTIIWLKPGATLEYEASFGHGRRVSLTGEGLFEVAKDSLHPFIVSVGDYTATVLGTSFYIKQSDNRRDMELAVLTGKVKVGRKDGSANFESQVVHPDEKLLTGDKLSVGQLTAAESKSYLAGTSYDMNFRDTAFDIVVNRIEQKFDVAISGNLAPYASCRFTADLTDQGLEYTLELLCRSMGITYSLKDKKVLFEGGGCK